MEAVGLIFVLFLLALFFALFAFFFAVGHVIFLSIRGLSFS